MDLLPHIPWWVFPVLGTAACFPRFYRLTELSAWPFLDDAFFSFYSIELLKNWNWRFFFAQGQHPPLFNWCQSLFFHFFPPSLTTLWLFPALLSTAALAAGYAAVQKLFSRSFSFFCVFLWAFSFWPVFTGRICQPTAAVPFWELLTFGILAAYLKAETPTKRKRTAVLLGLATGLGFYVGIAWVLAAFLVALAMVYVSWREPRNHPFLSGFFFPLGLLMVLYLLISFEYKNGAYIKMLWGFYPGMDWEKRFSDIGSQFAAIFWSAHWRKLYGPVWGGMLNPFLGSLLMTGFLEGVRIRKTPLMQWMFLALPVLFLPAVLAEGFDTFRIFLLLPILIFFMAAGIQVLLSHTPGKREWIALAVILGISMGLDFHHLFFRFHQIWGIPGPHWTYRKTPETFRAYQILKKTHEEKGAGAFLGDLRTHVVDPALSIALYPFDSCMNPGLSFADSQWVAVMVDADYKPFLSERFPGGKWYWLGTKIPYGGWMLGVIPLEPQTRKVFQKWVRANEGFSPATSQVRNNMFGESQKRILELLFEKRSLVKGDPFLETCFWEKVLTHRMIDWDYPGCLAAIQEGLKNGYALPEFLNEEGVIDVHLGKYREARSAFQKAIQSQQNLTPAFENLKALEKAGY